MFFFIPFSMKFFLANRIAPCIASQNAASHSVCLGPIKRHQAKQIEKYRDLCTLRNVLNSAVDDVKR